MTKPRTLLALALMALGGVAATSCSKTCKCIRYDMTVHYYSEDEVDDLGGSCSKLKFLYSDDSDPDPFRYYTVCEWERD